MQFSVVVIETDVDATVGVDLRTGVPAFRSPSSVAGTSSYRVRVGSCEVHR